MEHTGRAVIHFFFCWRTFKETITTRIFQPSGRASVKNPEYPPFFYRHGAQRARAPGNLVLFSFQRSIRTRFARGLLFGNADRIEENPPPGFHGTQRDTIAEISALIAAVPSTVVPVPSPAALPFNSHA